MSGHDSEENEQQTAQLAQSTPQHKEAARKNAADKIASASKTPINFYG